MFPELDSNWQIRKGFTMKSNGGKPSPSVPLQHMYTSTTTQGIWVRNFQTCPKMNLVENATKFIRKFSEFSKLGGITYKFYCHNPSSNVSFDFGCLIEPQRGKVNVEEWPMHMKGMWKEEMFDFTNYAGGSKRCLQFELLSGSRIVVQNPD